MLMLKTATVLEAISKRRRTARPAAHTGMSKNTIFAATHSPRMPSCCSTPQPTASPPSTPPSA